MGGALGLVFCLFGITSFTIGVTGFRSIRSSSATRTCTLVEKAFEVIPDTTGDSPTWYVLIFQILVDETQKPIEGRGTFFREAPARTPLDRFHIGEIYPSW